MTRRPVKTTDGRTVYFDEATGKYYEEDKSEVKGLVSLDEHPKIHHPNRDEPSHWEWAEDENGKKWPFPRLTER